MPELEKYIRGTLFAAIIFLLTACGSKSNDPGETVDSKDKFTETKNVSEKIDAPLKKFEWLLGEWSNEVKGQMIGEYWSKTNDSLFQGNGFGLKDLDTIFKESLRIMLIDGEIYYVPTVSGQNDNQPVLFKVIEVAENSFVSENKSHDYPQIIRYKLETQSSLLATLEGKLNGKETKREFRFRKATIRLMP